MQLGYMKYCCFICEWDSRAKDKHHSVKHYQKKRPKQTPGERNVVHDPLADTVKVFFTATPYKTWFSKKLCLSYKEGWPCFLYLQQKFPRLSEAKIRKGIWSTNKGSYRR
jgi:hypothetical protein